MDTSEIRRKAREHLQSNWALSIGVAAVACLLGGMLIGTSFLPNIQFSPSREFSLLFPFTWQVTDTIRITIKSGLPSLAAFLIGGVLQLGYARFLLKQHDGKELDFNDLFSQFDRFGTGFAQNFLRTLYTFLWSLLLIVPGIIAALSYAMTPFILEEHPELTASEAIARSKELMNGHKMDLFILTLTFLGWDILCALTANIGNLFLNPYKNAAYAVFYREISQPQTTKSQNNYI